MPQTHTNGRAGRVRARRAAAAGRAVVQALSVATAFALLLIVLLTLGAMVSVVRAAHAQSVAGGLAHDARPAGLFFRTERADAALEAPLLGSDVEIAVNGLIARVTVRQHFINPSNAWMEGIYVFPLPERSAVDRLTMRVGERRIEGKIMGRAEARKTYRKAAAEGRRASLLSSERPNVFTTSVANIGPGEEIIVEIEYQDTVAYEDGRFTLRFPMVVAPRYTPGGGAVPVAGAGAPTAQPAAAEPARVGSEIFGPVRHPENGPVNPVALAITLDAGLPLAELNSLYHEVSVEVRDDRRRVVTLTDGAVPADRDFVLEWRPQLGATPEAAVFAEEVAGDSYLLIMVLPPDARDSAPPIDRDLIFVVDTSGSMHGPSLDQAKEAMLLALDRLRPGERFNVIRFSNETHSLFANPRPVTVQSRRAAEAYVRSLRAQGGTEMLPALVGALAEAPGEGRLRQVVFLTDGAVDNEAELFRLIAGLLGDSRLFTVGIGSAPNSYFMRKAAEMGRGTFTYIGNVTEVSKRISALLRKLEHAELADVRHAWPGLTDGESESYPAPVPDLYAGEPVVVTARLQGVRLADLRGDLRVTGWRGNEAWRRGLGLHDMRRAPGVAAIWARAKIDHIEDGRFRGADPAEVRAAALDVALAHRLVSRYTSLVAVDEEEARPPDSPLASREVERNLPHGWDFEHVFGQPRREMKLRTLPPTLLRKTSGTTTAIGLPQTATSATRNALIGLTALTLGAVLVLVWLRRPKIRRDLA